MTDTASSVRAVASDLDTDGYCHRSAIDMLHRYAILLQAVQEPVTDAQVCAACMANLHQLAEPSRVEIAHMRRALETYRMNLMLRARDMT